MFEKWGFGMAPPKRATQSTRELWAKTVIRAVVDPAAPPWPADVREAISGVKGMFMRIFRMDQWDWFTVCCQLGHPSRGLSKTIGDALADMRIAARDDDVNGLRQAQKRLSEMPTRRCLRYFLGELAIADEPNAGWIYILSTREMPDLLKIGMTSRTVLERVREINNATGVAIPFGVRRCWRVSDPRQSEKLLHHVLGEFRLRSDREFFRADFFQVERHIQEALDQEELELRTGLRPAALLAN
ncbi:GIY-YIG nuclease family protein [Bradyrhizobium sp. USDA 4449]